VQSINDNVKRAVVAGLALVSARTHNNTTRTRNKEWRTSGGGGRAAGGFGHSIVTLAAAKGEP